MHSFNESYIIPLRLHNFYTSNRFANITYVSGCRENVINKVNFMRRCWYNSTVQTEADYSTVRIG
jgi:hypothetical protein